MESFPADAVIVGAGVVGLAIASALAERGVAAVVLEKNATFGAETSSRNSEVIHAGLYYPPDSMKARFCVEGRDALYAWCAARGVPHKRLGKIIAACAPDDEAALAQIEARAAAAGAGALRRLSRAEATGLEPALRCRSALLSPLTGVVDSHALMLSLISAAETGGASLALNADVDAIEERPGGGWRVAVGGPAPAWIETPIVINAAGLWAPSVAARCEGFALAETAPKVGLRLVKGSYFALSGVRAPFGRLIYPAPAPGGLGVHLTLDLSGSARFGPDVEALPSDDPAAVDYRVEPARASSFCAAIRRYWPDLPDGALTPDYAGVRPKAEIDGEADFRILGPQAHGLAGMWHLLGFESPALTASLAIGRRIAADAAASQ